MNVKKEKASILVIDRCIISSEIIQSIMENSSDFGETNMCTSNIYRKARGFSDQNMGLYFEVIFDE